MHAFFNIFLILCVPFAARAWQIWNRITKNVQLFLCRFTLAVGGWSVEIHRKKCFPFEFIILFSGLISNNCA